MHKWFSLIAFLFAVHAMTGIPLAVNAKAPVSILKGADSAKAMLKAAAPVAEKLKDTAKALLKSAVPTVVKDSAKAPVAKVAAPAAPAARDSAKVQPKPAPTAVTQPAPTGDCSVTKLVFARKVENRNPVEEGTEFQAADGQIVCSTRLACGSGPGVFKHVWYRDGVKMNEIVLNLKTGQGRVFTRKTITPGKWKVEVTTESGDVIGSGEMTVK